MQQIKLNTMLPGSVCYVATLLGSHKIKQCLSSAGFWVGAKIVVLRRTVYTNTFLLDVEGRILHIRNAPASLIEVSVPNF